ncbi:MAG: hypothetical protein AB7F78_22975, partial [Hyphomicrobiaceae bacterium]
RSDEQDPGERLASTAGQNPAPAPALPGTFRNICPNARAHSLPESPYSRLTHFAVPIDGDLQTEDILCQIV